MLVLPAVSYFKKGNGKEMDMNESTTSMRAVTVHAYGGADAARIENRPIPEPGPKEVQVSVAASSLNPLDYKARTGEVRLVMRAKLPKVLGGDFSGTVSALGAGVTGFAIGDEVFGCVDEFADARGSHAEYCVVPFTALSRKPGNISHEKAATLTMAGLTAWQALTKHAGLRSGQRLLVLGGSGGVGSFAIQVGKASGAHVTATASAANANLLRHLGADMCIDYSTTDYASLSDRFDVILDCTGKSSYFHARRVLSKGGTYLTTLPGPSALLGKLLAPLFGQRVVMLIVKYVGADGEKLAELVSAGKVQPLLSRTLKLDEVPAALESMRLGQRIPGKQVVKIR
jgi:NADPH:quinone reductase-like Zn-dependent oxidoreductase